jgi:xanthine dehydrogenase YagT iron-sulfur-binding subunit
VQPGLSRRAFLGTSTVITAGAAGLDAAASAPLDDPRPGERLPVTGPAPVPIALTVNGRTRNLRVEPRTTLAEALRDTLGLTGTKVACDRGACAACTVWVDGLPVASCMMLAVEVGSRPVTTIEGLARDGVLHPLQEAFVAHDAMQCGFCTPGMVMSCAALLERTQDPSAADVRAAISGHLCRCGTYPHVIAATLAAAKAGQG